MNQIVKPDPAPESFHVKTFSRLLLVSLLVPGCLIAGTTARAVPNVPARLETTKGKFGESGGRHETTASSPLLGGSRQAAFPSGTGRHMLSGEVRDEAGRPVAEARIAYTMMIGPVIKTTLSGATVQPIQALLSSSTDDSGKYDMEMLPDSYGMLTVQAEGFVPQGTSIQVTTATQQSFTLKKTGGATVKGRVLNAADGRPVENARIAFTASWPLETETTGVVQPKALGAQSVYASTDAQGYFSRQHLPPAPAEVQVHAAKPGLYPVPTELGEQKLSLKEGETTTIGDLLVYPGYTISGTVRDQQSQEPLAGTTVTLIGSTIGLHGMGEIRSAVTDENGSYTLTQAAPTVLPGISSSVMPRMSFGVRLEKPGYETVVRAVVPDQDFDLGDLKLQKDFTLLAGSGSSGPRGGGMLITSRTLRLKDIPVEMRKK